MNSIKILAIIIFYWFVSSPTLFAQSINITVIETSDVHGAIFPFNFTSNRESNNSLAQVLTYIEKERADTNQLVLLLDNGDILQGDPSVYYYNFEKTDTTHLLARVMNFMKFWKSMILFDFVIRRNGIMKKMYTILILLNRSSIVNPVIS